MFSCFTFIELFIKITYSIIKEDRGTKFFRKKISRKEGYSIYNDKPSSYLHRGTNIWFMIVITLFCFVVVAFVVVVVVVVFVVFTKRKETRAGSLS